MYCKKCGFKLESDSNFCEKCGTKVDRDEIEEIVNSYEEENDKKIAIEYEKKKNIEEITKSYEEENDKKINVKNSPIEEIDVSYYKPDDLDELIPKKNPIKILLCSILIIGLSSILIYFAFDISKKQKAKKENSISNQDIINEYAKSIEDATSKYLDDHEIINDFDEISDLVKYDKHEVSCDNVFINIDGTVHLSECTIDGKKVDESYGTKKNILTKDADACHIDFDKDDKELKFYVDSKLISVYECNNSKCGEYKTDNFEYNSCLDYIAVIEDGNYKYLYNYKATQEVIDKLDEIVAVKDNDKYLGFIIKDSESNKYGYVDTRGISKIKTEYDSLGLISNDILLDRGVNVKENKIIASKKDKYGIINLTDGKEVVSFDYDNIYLGYNDKYVVKEDKKYYIYDSKEDKKSEKGYDMIFLFEKLMIVNENKKLSFLDYDGKKIIDEEIETYVDYKEKVINGVFGYNAYKKDNEIIIEVNKSGDDGYDTIKYSYNINNKKLNKQ